MAVRKMKLEAVPKSRFQWSPLYDTKEWKDAIRNINRGLGSQEAIEVRLEKETVAALPLKDPVSALVVALRRYLKRQKLKYEVYSRAVEDDSMPAVYVANRVA